MSAVFRPPPPALVRFIREVAERPLSDEEFRAGIKEPMGSHERDESLSLIEWFMRRYPTPSERLVYARRMERTWRGPPDK